MAVLKVNDHVYVMDRNLYSGAATKNDVQYRFICKLSILIHSFVYKMSDNTENKYKQVKPKVSSWHFCLQYDLNLEQIFRVVADSFSVDQRII